jgi:CubicO group peptidase (beta-lactamase class C family)/membrane protein DedA with SNARE-associated domain
MALSRRRVGWADVACLGGLTAGWVYYLAIIPLFPSLIGTHPVLLEALNGSMPAQLAAGAFARVGRAPLILALLAPITGMMAFDPFWWWAGRRYGDRITQVMAVRNPRTARSVNRGMRLFHRFGGWTVVFAYFLPVPNNILYAMAGWAGFGLLRFIVLDLAGTMLWALLNVGLGYALGARAVAVATLISRYSIAATVALIAGLILVAWWRNRRGDATPLAAVAAGPQPGAITAPPVAVEAVWEPDVAAAAQVAAHLRPLVADGTVPGVVYAVVTPGGQATGHLSRSGSEPLGPHVLLEIGSVTKVFTALLLADMAERHEVGLDDPIARHLPPAVAQACPAADRITLRQLATHTSGLPRLPRNLYPLWLRHPADPYAGYSTEHLYRALRRASNPAPAPYLYSNYGFGLLGHLLSHTAGRPYAELLAQRVTGPLGLTETVIGVPDGHPAATGHRRGRPTARWHLGALAGAGALNSTAADLARFLSASLHPEATGLRSAIEAIQRPAESQQTGLGWHISSPAARPVLWHNGGTGGFSAMLALDRDAGCAIGAVATSGPADRQPLDAAVLTALAELIRPAPVPGS